MKTTFTLLLIAMISHFSASSMPGFLSPATSEFAQLRSNLYIVAPDKSIVLMDGTLTQYDADYTNQVDGMDARKMFNSSENLGMVRGNTILIIERRQTIRDKDSVLFKIWNLRPVTYQLELEASNLNTSGRAAVLEDNYLHTSIPVDLNGTSHINFSVTDDPESKASDRFTLVFFNVANSALPLTFTFANAFEQNNAVTISWKTENEKNLKEYIVQRSVDGEYFENTMDLNFRQATSDYHWVDPHPVEGNNYYRICGQETDGNLRYSDTMKVSIRKGKENMSIFPNPAIAGNLNLRMINQPAGIYDISLVSSYGQRMMLTSIQYAGGSSNEYIKTPQNIIRGIYQLEIKSPGGEKKVISVVFLN